ncbi:carboxyl transferase domain-containing protein [Solicola sp. PLA-1-18]|uniref:acetyl-CoA carboxylase family protein n=1 Tax=Solicola sp. PLA-1-18 TaxID=3380532 RepID=UPI003B7AE8A7
MTPLGDVDTLLVANRGEVALRVVRAAGDRGLRTVAVHSRDDAGSPHVRLADHRVELPGDGPWAYLDQAALLAAAVTHGAHYVHPGYGFLSEDAAFARACADRGLAFVGPSPTVLDRFGDKVAARDAARAAGLRTLPGTGAPTSPDQVRRFLERHPDGVMIKAVRGGGGRGMAEVRHADDVDAAFARCTAEAEALTGSGHLYAERLVEWARHVEVQVVGAPSADDPDVTTVLALGDRDCSVQRAHQKLVEIAPAPRLRDGVRRRLHVAAARLAASVGLRGIATVEMLVSGDEFVFCEVNPRLQVEHTVTEAVTGVDLVATQIEIARGAVFPELGLPGGVVVVGADGEHVSGVPLRPEGIAIEARVNAETVLADGTTRPTSGTVTAFAPPAGAGIRVDTYAGVGLEVSGRYDSLLAKVVTAVRGDSVAGTAERCAQALDDFALEGVRTNRGLLQAILRDEEFGRGAVGTDYLERRLPDLLTTAERLDPEPDVVPDQVLEPVQQAQQPQRSSHRADTIGGAGQVLLPHAVAHTGQVLHAEVPGTVIELAPPGTVVGEGEPVALVESMKMHHVLQAPADLVVGEPLVSRGAPVAVGDAVLTYDVRATADDDEEPEPDAEVDLDLVRDDLARVLHRHEIGLDAARGRHVAAVHERGRRTARENIADLVDSGSFVEHGPLAVAAQRGRRSEEDLVENTPADGMVCGLATVNAAHVGTQAARVAVLSYDYTVLAGTQGARNHAKTDRLLELAAERSLPVVLFPEGGGGRPGDVDAQGTSGLELGTFAALGRLSGRVPLVAVVSGRCFAGNAALLGMCDVVIATPDATIGMGGPAMVEGGGLGTYTPEQIGPVDVHRRTGVIHVLAADEAEAVATARDVVGWFQGPRTSPAPPDRRVARHVVPADRLRAYDVRAAVDALADPGSVIELAPEHGPSMVTALTRVDGRPLGVVANSSDHLSGAIDVEAAQKLAGFWRTCDDHGVPVLALCDTPGFMVGPDAERDGGVRHLSRLFVEGARLSVPYGMVVLRRAYGLGAMAMASGSFRAPSFVVAWPTGEIGAMGLEGAVRLGFRRELDAEPDPVARDALFAKLVAEAYAQGTALSAASSYEIDDVIDPADTRRWIRTLFS